MNLDSIKFIFHLFTFRQMLLRKPNQQASRNKDSSLTPSKKYQSKPSIPVSTEPSPTEKKILKQQFSNYFHSQIEKTQSPNGMTLFKNKSKETIFHDPSLIDELKVQIQDQKLQILHLETQLKNQKSKLDETSTDSELFDLKNQNTKIFHELRLETQNRQILQQQVEQLIHQNEKLIDENNKLTAQNSKINLSSQEGSLQQTFNLKLQSDISDLRYKYEELENKFSSERQEKQQLLQTLTSSSCHSKARIQVSQEKRNKSPFLSVSPKLEKKKLETQLEQVSISKLNIEKAFEVKLSEAHQNEQQYLEKIARLEKQLKSRNYFDQDKRPQLQELEKANANYKSQIEQLRITSQAQILDLNNQLNSIKNLKNHLDQQLKQLQYDKMLQDKRYSDQVELIKQLKQQLIDLKASSLQELSDLKIKSSQAEKSYSEKLMKLENEIHQQRSLLSINQQEIENWKNKTNLLIQEKDVMKVEWQSYQVQIKQQEQTIIESEKQLKLEQQNLNQQLQKYTLLESELKVLHLENENNKKLISHLQSIRTTSSNWEGELNRLQDSVNDIVSNICNISNGQYAEDEFRISLYRADQDIRITKDDVYIFETDINEYLQDQIKNLQEYVKELDQEIIYEDR